MENNSHTFVNNRKNVIDTIRVPTCAFAQAFCGYSAKNYGTVCDYMNETLIYSA